MCGEGVTLPKQARKERCRQKGRRRWQRLNIPSNIGDFTAAGKEYLASMNYADAPGK
jgi:hypothetical protein